MTLQPFGIKVSQKRNKLTVNEIITITLSILLAISTIYLGWQNNNLQEKQTNYPTQAYEYTEASVEGTYVNNSTYPTSADGFLNITFIISTSDIAKLVIENCSFTPNTRAVTFFDYSKLSDWFVGPDDSSIGSTYYINQTGINEIKVSIPIKAIFYINASHDWLGGGISKTDETVVLGDLTVSANLIDMQTNMPMPFSFSTTLFTDVTITEQ
jgi:hypothetical protein